MVPYRYLISLSRLYHWFISISCLNNTRLPNVIIEIRNLEKALGMLCSRKSLNKAYPWLSWENGAGKTTMLPQYLRFLDYKWWDPPRVAKRSPARSWGEIGYLPEERSLMSKLTIFEQVRHLAALKGNEHRRGHDYRLMEKLQVKGKLTDEPLVQPTERCKFDLWSMSQLIIDEP